MVDYKLEKKINLGQVSVVNQTEEEKFAILHNTHLEGKVKTVTKKVKLN